tara:strand:+ start:6 stop:926 length:921 start_codon:yes stop_codon:yes gene_type:complete
MDLSKTIKKIEKIPFWSRMVFLLAVIMIFMYINNNSNKLVEGFNNQKQQFVSKNKNLFDDFYCDIYDQLMYSKNKNNFEIKKVSLNGNIKNKMILDVGSGTGHHVNSFSKLGAKCVGIDKSESMVKKAKQNYPKLKFIREDVLKTITFPQETYDFITCFYFTLYYIKDKQQFFHNCFNWLKPGGKLIIHLVNKEKFNPMVPAGDPFIIVSPQNYSDKRITKSTVVFNNFKYDANFSLNNSNIGKLKETIRFNNSKKVRENEHILYMEDQNSILRTAQNSGFILEKKFHMLDCEYDYQYLYILTKPN